MQRIKIENHRKKKIDIATMIESKKRKKKWEWDEIKNN